MLTLPIPLCSNRFNVGCGFAALEGCVTHPCHAALGFSNRACFVGGRA
jgi:hypothetical protein